MMALTEEQFQQQIIDLAHLCGWTVAHFRAAMTAKGWRTPVQADGAGFPDLVMVKTGWDEIEGIDGTADGLVGRLIFAEIKSAKGKVSESQQAWLSALRCVDVEVYVWKPSDWERIVQILQE